MTNTEQRKRTVLFLYANDPDPIVIERMQALIDTGRYVPSLIYWHRKESPIAMPFFWPFAPEQAIRTEMPDPRSGRLKRLYWTLRFALKVRGTVKRLKPDQIHAAYPDMLAVARFALLGDRKTSVIYEFRDVFGPGRVRAAARFLYRWVAKRADAVVTTSPEYGPRYLRANGIVGHDTPIVYVSNAPAGWTYSRQESERNHAPLTIGYFGMIRVAKQIEALIDAAQRVTASGRNVRIVFAGSGVDTDLVERLSSQHDFIQYWGAYDHTNVQQLYQTCDVIFAVYPQTDFNYQTHVARRYHEAMLSGLPIIVAKGSFMAKLVEEYRSGWQVNDTSTDEYEELLTWLCDNPEEVVSHRPTAEAATESRFEAFIETFIETCDRAAERRQAI